MWLLCATDSCSDKRMQADEGKTDDEDEAQST
jgi:hypothetical protein